MDEKFGQDYAACLRPKTPSLNNIWHLDKVVVTIGGRNHWLWRAVDQDGYILTEIVQRRRDTKACQASADATNEKAGMPPQAHRHRQALLS